MVQAGHGAWLRRFPGRLFGATVVANSRAGLDAYGIAAGRGRVIPNGFDPARLRGDRASAPAGHSSRFTVVMTGSMYPGKDYATLMEAARRFVERIDAPCRFVFVGDGCDRSHLLHLGRDLAEAGILEIRDRVDDVIAIVQDADVGVLLDDPRFHAEGCANSLLEYMACGLPVVATDTGGNPEVVRDGVNGFLVEPGDADAVAQALVSLYTSPALAKRFGQEGRRVVETVFSAEAMVRSYRRLYEEVVASR